MVIPHRLEPALPRSGNRLRSTGAQAGRFEDAVVYSAPGATRGEPPVDHDRWDPADAILFSDFEGRSVASQVMDEHSALRASQASDFVLHCQAKRATSTEEFDPWHRIFTSFLLRFC
jgi:hypothetical protein